MPVNILLNIDKYMDAYYADPNGRRHAYDHVHDAFKRYLKDEISDDCMALHLYAFLASWGMVCRGTILLQKDYKCLIPIVQLLKGSKYHILMDYDPFSPALSDDEYIALVLELKEEITAIFRKQGKYDDEKGKMVPIARVSDALIGKILLGTYSCIPAYDSHVREAMKGEGIENKITQKGLQDLLNWIRANKTDFQKAISTYPNVPYPVMKRVDEALW